VKESNMHVELCHQWGVGLGELESTPESAACTAYGAYIMDVGMKGASNDLRRSADFRKFIFMHVKGNATSLFMALAACLIGYGQVGRWLHEELIKPFHWGKLEHNPYRRWIEDYAGERYQAAVKVGIGACAYDNCAEFIFI
jgi:hydroxymethylpyrimidine/phosphomethylpyrimidine kinase